MFKMCAVVSLTTNRIYKTNHTITKISTTKLSRNVELTRVNTRKILIYQCKYLQLVPVLALFESRTLDFRESKCLFRGLKILMGINNYKQSW